MTWPACRVLHVATRFLWGGSERIVAELCHALQQRGYEQLLAVGRDSDADRIRALCPDVPYIVVPHLRREPRPADDVAALFELGGIIRRWRPQMLHTIQSKAGVLGRTASWAAGVPVRIHSLVGANFGAAFGPAGMIYGTAERLLEPTTDAYLVVGADLRDRYVRARIGRAEKYAVVRSPVDVAGFRAARSASRQAARLELGLRPDVACVAIVGALTVQKGMQQVPALAAALARHAGPVSIAIAGRGPLEEWLKAQAAGAPASHIRVLGYRADVPTVMAAADCLVSLSRAEGMPSVMVEATAAGRPFVSMEVDGPRELISLGAAGTVVPQGDVDAVARAVAGYLRRPIAAPELDLSAWETSAVNKAYLDVFETFSSRAR